MNFRPELYHPISVHFPIVLVFLLVFLKIFLLATKDQRHREIFYPVFIGGICLSLVFSMVSVYLGDMAYETIKTNVCSHQSVGVHDDYSKLFLIFSSLWLFSEILSFYFREKVRRIIYLKLFTVLSILTMSFVTYYLFNTAHSGANLVYEEGLGVHSAMLKECQYFFKNKNNI